MGEGLRVSGFSYIHASGITNSTYNERFDMSEIIRITNFGGIEEMEMELKPINVIIGPQASGKSVTVKLLYFFKSFFIEVYESILYGKSKQEMHEKQINRFKSYFPNNSWPSKSFKIDYSVKNTFISVESKRINKNRDIKLTYSENINQTIDKTVEFRKDWIATAYSLSLTPDPKLKDYFNDIIGKQAGSTQANQQMFIPAGRSFYANIRSIALYLGKDSPLDPFVEKFGSFYETLKKVMLRHNKKTLESNTAFDVLASEILNGRYTIEEEKAILIHNDSRKVDLFNASSGQQEVLPLILILKAFDGISQSNTGASIYIEEPEAHLFPASQKRIVRLFARAFNEAENKLQYMITTHSPYILASFNNLMEAGKVLDKKENLDNKLYDIIPKEEIISTEDLAAYALVNGVKTDLIDPSTKLISQNILDSVSDEISIEFGKLLDLEF